MKAHPIHHRVVTKPTDTCGGRGKCTNSCTGTAARVYYYVIFYDVCLYLFFSIEEPYVPEIERDKERFFHGHLLVKQVCIALCYEWIAQFLVVSL